MQEWVLTESGGEFEAAGLRQERAQAEALAAGQREWESLLRLTAIVKGLGARAGHDLVIDVPEGRQYYHTRIDLRVS